MIPLSSSSATSSGLTWKKIPFSGTYELRMNGEVVGTLRRAGWLSLSFLAETQVGNWTFRCRLLDSGAEILDSATQQPIASFKSSWGTGGGELTFTDGQTFRLKCAGWWRPVWSVIAENGQTLVQLHTREKTVEGQNGSAVPESRLALLIMFTWYRVRVAEEDAATAVVIAAT